ncbi:MAG TPA: tetratricopeptide repeat protein [Pyrinomonadaceae bacterium]|nr:tetratricopeptide repeat protein [Pyrinomonadaceae bacterium]
MSYQLPPLNDDAQFERLVRDILRRVYDDPGVERFGRSGQAQHGIDGFSATNPGITFQTKLKDTRFEKDERLRAILLAEMEEELEKTRRLSKRPERFIFATTFKNDAHLQQTAVSLSDDAITVEYWGWDTINEKIWEYAEFLIPTYYPHCPIRQVSGFKPINLDLITKLQASNSGELNQLAIEYYRINDRSEVVLRVVCNDIDVRNDEVMEYAFRRLKAIPSGGTLWLLGSGGCGKTTLLHRLAVELAQSKQNVYMLNLEAQLGKDDLETVLSWLKYGTTSERTVLCIDNPAADEETMEALLRRVPDYCPEIHILLAERRHRYHALQRTGSLTYLHGEEEQKPLDVRNPPRQRQRVYDKLFKLLGLSAEDTASLRDIVLNERLVYVNATYSILLELKRKQKIDFHFDWDDYRKSTSDLPAFNAGYKYIALFYLFGVRTPFAVLSKIYGADETQRRIFLERFRGLVNEPIIVDEKRDDSFRKSIHVRTKHEIISELFFREHPDLNKNELLMEWCEHTDFADALESQALINILGAKKNYLSENAHIDFPNLINFLLQGYLREQVALAPKLNATLHLAKFWLLLFQNKPEEAITLLESFLERVPGDLHSRTELAKLYLQRGRFTEAEAALLKILDIKPGDLNSRTELAKVYQRQNRLAEAEAVLLKLLEIDKDNIRAHTELAKIYQRQNKLIEAEAALLFVLNIKPNDLNSRTELAKIYQRQNKLDKAEAVLLKLLEIDADDLQARTELAKIYQRQGKLAEATRLLEEEIDLAPKALHPRTELAKIYQRQGKLDEAIQRLEEYIELEPRGLHPRTELAKIYQRQNKLDKAEAVLLKLLEIDANNLQARTELAKIYQRQNKLDKAEALLLESLEIDPLQLHPRTELAKIYQRQGKFAEAEAILLKILNIKATDLNSRTELAKIYQRQGRLDVAAERVEEVLRIDPLNDHAMSELLGIWRRQGEGEKCARRFLEFIGQAGYRFSRYSQAPVFRFFHCCRDFKMKESADLVFERFERELDEQNLNFYMRNFR